MGGKQMEGDNQRRRALARRAREEGRAPSEAGVTLGASKQPEHTERSHREGPPPAGPHKPVPHSPTEGTPPRPGRPWPRWDPEAVGVEPNNPGWIRYRDLVNEVGRRADLDFDHARLAAEATATVLARALDKKNRRQFLDGLPMELYDDYAINVPYAPLDLNGFLVQVGTIVHRERDQARYQVQTVLSTMAEQDHDLIESLELPDYVRDLTTPPPTGGGVVGPPPGGVPPLTDEELREALARLPLWSGDHHALRREIVLPPENLDRVLQRLAALRQEVGRAPHIGRERPDTATLVVRTTSVDAVTRLDVDLAHRVDAAVLEAGAGMAAG
jgi:pterin-4a-carbinolamine dehydratase